MDDLISRKDALDFRLTITGASKKEEELASEIFMAYYNYLKGLPAKNPEPAKRTRKKT